MSSQRRWRLESETQRISIPGNLVPELLRKSRVNVPFVDVEAGIAPQAPVTVLREQLYYLMARLSGRVEPQESFYPHLGQGFHGLVQLFFKATAENVVLSEIRDLSQDVRLLGNGRGV